MSHWIEKSNIYHIYPLGFCGCEQFRNECENAPVSRIKKIIEWIPHLKAMHFNAVYLGPVFESVKHGYDTTDYTKIDGRLGTNEDFEEVCRELHENGIKVILDGVFNHVGRNHFAFADLKANGQNSRYKDWFCGINFGGHSPYGDNFSYEGWNGCYDLVKLNLYNNEVVEYLFSAVKIWIEKFDIDGIRFDAADCLNVDFIKRIRSFTKQLKADIWLMGEVIHGDYKRWANSDMFDSVTNYQCYKGIYSSHNDRNYFEIAHNIEYEFNQYGNIYMYNFVDNHDVPRLMSVLKNHDMAECCYTLMYMMYGVPSVYYGSEFGLRGEKGKGENADVAIRPCIELDGIPDRDDVLSMHISALGAIRESLEAVQSGSFTKIELKNQTFLFKREKNNNVVYVALNIGDGDYTFRFTTPYTKLADRLSGKQFVVNGNNAEITVPSNGSMILVECVSCTAAVQKKDQAADEPISDTITCCSPAKDKGNGVSGAGVPEGKTAVINGRYRHFKGGEYVLNCIALDHEGGGKIAVYTSLGDDARTWARPLDMFLENVDDHGVLKPRFDYIGLNN